MIAPIPSPYPAAFSGQATRPAGMVQLAMSVQDCKTDPRWTSVESWFANTTNWTWFMTNKSYCGYDPFVKAMRSSKTRTLSNGFDWFADPAGIARNILSSQQAGGNWPASQDADLMAYGEAYQTAWAVTMLVQGAVPRTLTVRSSPAAGVHVTGTARGNTNYAADVADQANANLVAPAAASISGKAFTFVPWSLDSAPQPRGQMSLQIVMAADRAAEAIYRLDGDVNDDCQVNVLDLITIRNNLGRNVAEDKNWQYDGNGDGRINVLDLIACRKLLGAKCQ